MASQRLPCPFKIVPLDDETQAKIAKDFLGYPNGLASCNHWGFKVSATLTAEELEDFYNYPLDPRDIWVVTPPKCGTTWAQEMVWLLANDLDYEGAKTPLMPNRWNYVDISDVIDNQYMEEFKKQHPSDAKPGEEQLPLEGDPNRPSPRFVKSHLPMSMNNPRLLDTCKVVYVARNPKDLCVSFYHHCKLYYLHGFTGDLELFAKHFLENNLILSPFIEHMIEAWNLRHHPNMCFIFYEGMKRDLKSQIHKVATFLGKSYSDEQVDKLASHLHIDNFKNNPFTNREHEKDIGMQRKDRGNFVRKGKTGDWKNHFTPEMNAEFNRFMAEAMKGTDLQFVEELGQQD